ncbi:MAG: hypothetical protein FJ399_09080 [Verrucomicrobia bacterium]|nr:hypothetical protein [Verrucomicrobiota bacterium]
MLKNEELVVLLLGGAQRFEPFLIRAAGELLRAVPIDVARLASLARRERCARVLAHLARLGCQHDAGGAAFWQELRDAIGPQRTVSGGVLPHWTRFVLLNGVNRTGQALDSRWVGTIP